MQTMKYRYFVSYNYIERSGVTGFGNSWADTVVSISEMEHIREIEKHIAERSNLKNVCIINFIQLNCSITVKADAVEWNSKVNPKHDE